MRSRAGLSTPCCFFLFIYFVRVLYLSVILSVGNQICDEIFFCFCRDDLSNRFVSIKQLRRRRQSRKGTGFDLGATTDTSEQENKRADAAGPSAGQLHPPQDKQYVEGEVEEGIQQLVIVSRWAFDAAHWPLLRSVSL